MIRITGRLLKLNNEYLNAQIKGLDICPKATIEIDGEKVYLLWDYKLEPYITCRSDRKVFIDELLSALSDQSTQECICDRCASFCKAHQIMKTNCTMFEPITQEEKPQPKVFKSKEGFIALRKIEKGELLFESTTQEEKVDYKIDIRLEPWTGELRADGNTFTFEEAKKKQEELQRILYSPKVDPKPVELPEEIERFEPLLWIDDGEEDRLKYLMKAFPIIFKKLEEVMTKHNQTISYLKAKESK